MKENLILALKTQKNNGEDLNNQIENISSTNQLDNFLIKYKKWNDTNHEILKNAYIDKQLFNMYLNIKLLGNVNIDDNSFQAKRRNVIYCLPKQILHLETAITKTNYLKNIDLLPFKEQLIPFDKNNSTKNMKKIFISHSSIDKEKIKPLIDLIEGIGVSENQIFYSSHSSYGISLGENIFERLKRELDENVLALFMLSENFYKSPVCLCEMGAIWIKSNKQIPILIPPFDFKSMEGVFPNSIGFKINDKNQLNSFKEQLELYFNLSPISFTRWEEKREEYLLKINSLLK
ncbi:toll/interleukin-1 receptor domain-containing protein [Flavobacterium branchiicola]|uniref:Toll/interleukin-1 receptor domain-containing protein n=1 Tax=Flavobacterium branchiicola TaxID=1114875 RepID=A0ABV9PGH2_9FLAO|nr:toll/interleukin-1 receptor domain-containing protein [Flavobacterium branchiicola]MBS7255995.1 toll/interleukin-1 receptor domain-containing protein [Flavobacterium branchiicola]